MSPSLDEYCQHRPAGWNLSVLFLPDDGDIRVGVRLTSEQYIGRLLYRYILWTLDDPRPLCTDTVLLQPGMIATMTLLNAVKTR